MKKTEGNVLVHWLLVKPIRMVAMIVVTVLIFSAVLFGIPRLKAAWAEEVLYTGDQKKYTPVYADIVRIEPMKKWSADGFGGPDLYCRCTLADGSTIWARFGEKQYRQQVDSHYGIERETIFTTPLRLHGTAETVGKVTGLFSGRYNSVLDVDSVEFVNAPQ